MRAITIRLLHDKSTQGLSIEVDGKRIKQAGMGQAGVSGAMREVRRAMAGLEKTPAGQERGLYLVEKS